MSAGICSRFLSMFGINQNRGQDNERVETTVLSNGQVEVSIPQDVAGKHIARSRAKTVCVVAAISILAATSIAALVAGSYGLSKKVSVASAKQISSNKEFSTSMLNIIKNVKPTTGYTSRITTNNIRLDSTLNNLDRIIAEVSDSSSYITLLKQKQQKSC